jgi:hypothetical protein
MAVNASDFDSEPTWTVEEAFAAFHKWIAENEEEVGDLPIDEQAERYYADWKRRNN